MTLTPKNMPGISSSPSSDGAMPVPRMSSSPPGSFVSAMPVPTMKVPSTDGMPRPTTAFGMATAPASGSAGMPIPTPILASHGGAGGAGNGTGIQRYEPGVVEVQFKEGAFPSVARVASGVSPALHSAAQGPLDTFNELTAKHGLLAAESTFETSHADATMAQQVARTKGIDAPHLGHFVTLHFANDADTVRIAAELSKLPEVERAVAVPRAIPPIVTIDMPRPRLPVPLTDGHRPAPPPPELRPPTNTPLTEPLVGSTSTVVTNPVTGLDNQWYLFRCGVDGAWARASGKGVVVADVDWGCRTSHEDLQPNIDKTYNAFDGTAIVTSGGSVFHGTGVAGLVGAAVNGKGMAGIAYEASVWPVQADSGTSPGLGGNAWARGIDWVRTTDSGGRRKVVILEVQTGAFGNYEQVPSVNAAIKTAIAADVVVCVAAGNGNKDASLDDAGNAIPETGSILIGATAYDATINKRAWFSNYGSRITVCAPGDSDHDLTADSTSDTAYRNGFGGTSGATPKVAGAAALLLQVNPSLSHADVRAIIEGTGTAVTDDPGKPVGRLLNADAAVRQAITGDAGRLEIFARGSDQALYHNWQVVPNGGWSGWASLGGWIDRLATSRNGDGRLEVFARGSDQALYHNWQVVPNGGWSGWASLGGWIDLLAVAPNADGRLEVFARGSDQALYHNWQVVPNGGWSGWASLGGWIDRLAASRNQDGRLEVFARGSDGAVYHNWQTTPGGGWSGWASLGGWIDILSVASNLDGRLELFARGSDGALYHNWQVVPNGGWSGWASLGGWIDLLTVKRNADGRLEVFARGSDKALYHNWQVVPNGGWSGWASLGGWIDELSAIQNQDGRLEVVARGSDQAVYHNWQVVPNGGWSGWASLGGWIDLLDAAQNAL